MKKILLTFIIGMFLLSIVLISAGIISNINKDLEVTEEQKQALINISLETYNITDSNLGTEKVERCLKKEGAINKCKTFPTFYNNCSEYNVTEFEENITEQECIKWEKIYYSEREILEKLDEWEKQSIELIANATISRADKQREIVREGLTTIKIEVLESGE